MANTKVTTKSKVAAKKSTASSTKKPASEPAKKPKASSSETTSKKTNKKSKTGLIVGIIVALALIIIGVIVALLCLKQPDQSDPTAKLDYSKSFFIYDDGKYTLWNADGKRLTEDEYQNQSDFLGGYAMVKKDDKYGIIDESGRMSVDFDKYGAIRAAGGLFVASGKDSAEQFLITGSGKVLETNDDLGFYAPSSSAGFVVVTVGDKVRVYNYAGTLMVETDKLGEEEDDEEEDESDAFSLHDFGVFYYGNKNWVFDTRDGKLLATFDGKKYSLDSNSDDRSIVLLDEYEDGEGCKLIVDGKLYDLNETKNYGLTDNNQVIGYDNYDELALLGDDYKVAKRVSTYVQLKDTNNYAEEKNEGGVTIYHNGQAVKEFGEDAEIPISGLVYNDLYAISEDDKIKFYNLDGSVAFNKQFEDIDVLSNKNHHAIVSEKNDEYYIIDASGNRVGDVVASDISYSKGGYKAEDAEGKYAILDKNGNRVTDFKYTDLYYRIVAEPYNLWTAKREDGNVDVIDVDSKRIVLEDVSIDSFYENYFTIEKENGDIEYYTFGGKLFYTDAA